MTFSRLEIFLLLSVVLIGICAGVVPGFRVLAILLAPVVGIVYYVRATKFFLIGDRVILSYVVAHFFFIIIAFSLLRAGSVLSIELIEAFSIVEIIFGIGLLGYLLVIKNRITDEVIRNRLSVVIFKILIVSMLPALFFTKAVPVFD